ncbi:MAG: NAD(P)/FAD-dependent oxidoreductase [Bacteriovoracaceae bacterium]
MKNKDSILKFSLAFDRDVESYLKKNHGPISEFTILSKSLDARNANRGRTPKYHYQVKLNHIDSNEQFEKIHPWESKPLIIGAGPAGLFAALRFAEYGIKTIIVERGDQTYPRMKKIARHWRYGEMDEDSNVCYGEGGAGLFSDGKLITRVKSEYVGYVLKRFYELGAPKDILYDSNPHVGSNKIREIIKNISKYLLENGHEIRFNSKVTELLYDQDKVVGAKLESGECLHSEDTILAIGHSAKKMFYHLHEHGVSMKAKDFAIGFRVEHPRSMIDTLQFGEFAEHHALGAARYRLSYYDKSSDRGSYSFCMCPGGYVLSSGTEKDGIVVNGMSNYGCRSRWSNSAIVTSVKNGVDYNKNGDNILDGFSYIENIEKKAFNASKEYADARKLPFQRLDDFLNSNSISDKPFPKNSTPSGIFEFPINEILPANVCEMLKSAFVQFDKRLPGFMSKEAIVMAPETRTSSPVTLLRDKENLQSLSHKGLYPIGEGAGHAGGITSAAVDGVKASMAVIKSHAKVKA